METLNEQEAAHVLRLLPSSDQVVLGQQGILSQWRDEIRKSFGDLSSYDGEINDKRIKVHLDEVVSTDDDISISSLSKWQILEARRLQKELKQGISVLEVFTMGSFGIDTMGRLHGLGEIVVESVRPIRDLCEMGPHVGSSSEAELAALLRALQMVRDAFAERGDSREFRQYRRLIFATGSIMSLRAVSGAGGHRQSERELKTSTRIAALCRAHATEILKRQQNIESVHFIWLPLNARAKARKS
jgi:ribonuclease HI